ncbi:sodium channel modifier 1 isoform X2 [Syngnathoides biaculeatus]|uniref:sodium channel modifier 1 isoform X2 n=1 Tax=Syngnathoides biaculeatus TaxID=300417 RepID=UPI002ADE4550|nr:sodium channel modifier 1 isoform X2 [Syngnathoides biaculeatus]
MSFKREGNDKSQLNILKKRRVADLLSNFIPEDEAALLSNGRYTCLVCQYRPVFDTVDMLTVHRKGKRHLEGLKAFYGKKAQLKHEITKRKQENFIQAEDQKQEVSSSEAPLLAQTRKLTHHALLRTGPYNSCHRRTSKTVKGPVSSKSLLEHTAPPCGPEKSEAVHCTSGPDQSHSSKTTGGRPRAAADPASEAMSAQRRRELEHYLKLKSDGWLRDPSGRWVKDGDVEFDSDEDDEPPSLPALPSGDSCEGP